MLGNFWETTTVDEAAVATDGATDGDRLFPFVDMAGIIARLTCGQGTQEDRARILVLATGIEDEATELSKLGARLRKLADKDKEIASCGEK